MIFYKNLILLLGLFVLGVVAVLGGVNLVAYKPAPSHRGSATPFSSEELKLAERTTSFLPGLKNPFGATTTIRGFPPVPLSQALSGSAATGNPDSEVRMVLIQEGRKFALVDGQIVREGDLVNTQRVVRIERDRVLLKGRNTAEKWVSIAPQRAVDGKTATKREGSGDGAGQEREGQQTDTNKRRG